jgi:hypothetical protein
MPKFIAGRGKTIISISIACGIGIFLLAAILTGNLHRPQQGERSKVVVGSKDAVYISHGATVADAQALGMALRSAGYFKDEGAEAALSKGPGGAVVSFSAGGQWNGPDTVYKYEDIGRRIAPSLGGFPITVRLMDSRDRVQRAIAVGKLNVGAKDELYYFGSATKADADALAQALKAGMYFTDLGAKVFFSRESSKAISFVVNKNAWERPDFFAVFQEVVRRAAPSVGGLPITMRMLDLDMEPQREMVIQ